MQRISKPNPKETIMKTLIITAAAAIAAVGAAFALAPQHEVRTEIAVSASPERVWNVLTDGAAYREWNPFIVDMKGTPKVGETLENTMQPGGGSAMTFRPTVLVADKDREFRWLGRLIAPRIFDGEHYFLLEETATGTRLVPGERFQGILLWAIDTEQFRADYERMNAALKARAEG